MIFRIEAIDEIIPIYSEYLNFMSRFYKIYDHASWHAGALKNLHKYSVEDDRYVYVFKKSELIIGFALANKHLRFNEDGLAVAEFYIQKKYQRQGYGCRLAEHVFSQFHGNWEVAVTSKNHSASQFWKQAVSFYTEGNFIERKTGSFIGYSF